MSYSKHDSWLISHNFVTHHLELHVLRSSKNAHERAINVPVSQVLFAITLMCVQAPQTHLP